MSLFYSAGLGNAIPDGFDSFEDGDLADWESTSEWGTTTNRAFDGNVSAVKTSGNSTHQNMRWAESVVAGDEAKTASGWIYYNGSDFGTGITLVGSSGSGHLIYLQDGNIRLFTVSDDSLGSQLDENTSFSLSNGWYKAIISHDGSDGFTGSVEDDQGTQLASVSANDFASPDRFGVHAYSTGVELDLVGIE